VPELKEHPHYRRSRLRFIREFHSPKPGREWHTDAEGCASWLLMAQGIEEEGTSHGGKSRKVLDAITGLARKPGEESRLAGRRY